MRLRAPLQPIAEVDFRASVSHKCAAMPVTESIPDSAEIQNALRTAIAAVIVLAKSRGVGPDFPDHQYRLIWWQKLNGGYQSRIEARTERSFEKLIDPFWEHYIALPEIQALSTAVEDFERAISARWWSPVERGAILLAYYFQDVGSLRLDDDLLQRIIDEYLREVASPRATQTTTVLLKEFAAAEPFTLGAGISVRPLSQADVSKFGRIDESDVVPFLDTRTPVLHSDDWIVVIERQISGGEGIDRELIEQIAAAFSLTKDARSKLYVVESTLTSRYLRTGYTRNPRAVYTNRRGGTTSFSTEDIHRCQQLFEALTEISSGDKFNYLRLALRRLRLATTRQHLEDQLVDYVVGLETLLAPDTESQEIAFRFRLRGASLLPEAFGSTSERISLMKKFYDVRSRAVHGEDQTQQLQELTPRAEEALRAIFHWYLTNPEAGKGAKVLVRYLDEALVAGGISWAYDQDKRGIVTSP